MDRVTVTAAGLVVIGGTGAGAHDTQRASLAALIAVEARSLRSVPRSSGSPLAVTWGHGPKDGSSAQPPARCSGSRRSRSNYITEATSGPLLGLVSPWTLTAMIAGVIAFYASARSLQIGDGVEVIALTSVDANLAAILGGIIVFHDPIGSGPAGITARFLAFCLVIAGAAPMPGPMRATPHAS